MIFRNPKKNHIPNQDLSLVVFQFISVALLSISLLLIVISWAIIFPYGNNIHPSVEDVPSRDIALIFGGGMEDKSTQSNMQKARVDAGIDLYRKGKVKKLIMTGDDGGKRADEVNIMLRYAIDNGIPINDVSVDPHGYRTYESCYREKHVYGLESVIAVSQDFHLPRIIFFCENFGIDTVGFSADSYTDDSVFIMEIRETFARVKGMWQILLTKPLPTVTK